MRVGVIAERDFAVAGHNRLAQVNLPRRHAKVGVRHQHAEHQQRVRVLDHGGHRLGARDAQVGAGQRCIVPRQQTTTENTGHHRNAQLTRQRGHLRLQIKAPHFDTRHQHRPLGGREARQDFIGTCVQRLIIDHRLTQRDDRLARLGHHVARQLDIHRARLTQATGQYARNLGRGGTCIRQAGLVAGNFLVDGELRIERLRLVMQQQAGTRFALARRAGDDHHGRLLRVGAGHRVDHVERTRAVSHGSH